jgi:hypothetical protein
MRPATEAQKKFAEAIAKELSIDLPKEVTRQSLFLFIRDNRPKFDEMQKNKRMQKKTRWNWLDCLDRDEDADMFWALGGDPVTGCLGD